MTAPMQHPLAADYVRRLRHAGRRLPRGRLVELVAEIEEHLAEAIPPEATDAEALTALDRLGTPEDIVDAEQPPVAQAAGRAGVREWAAIVLLLVGGFLAGIGWLVGLVLLCSSRAWTATDKWIGALVIPGGLTLPFLIFGIAATSGGKVCSGVAGGPIHCTGGTSGATKLLWLGLILVLSAASVASAVRLARRAS